MIENYIGQWKGKDLQKPSEFQRERIIDEIKLTLPEPPDQEEIIGFELPREEQLFKPTVIPKNFDELPRDERISFRVSEFNKRSAGVWFYNNGTIEYITGTHYFYLSFWKIDIGLPEFRDSDRDLHYLWKFCENDVNCFGLCYFTNRRSGKTVVGTNIIYEYGSRNEESDCGIQSKTKKDGQKVFKKLIGSWKKLHPIWKPTDSGETNPKEELRFEEPSKRSSKGVKKIYDKVLNSTISYRSSVEDSYDGSKLHRYYCDEFGKFTEGDASERWDIVKPCLVVGTTIVGKSYFTTTVEELEKKGGQAALDIYNGSDYNKRKKDGRTESGMYRCFKPAYYGLEGYIDRYGYSDVKGAKNALIAQRDGLTGSKLAGEVRRFPFTAKEAFYSTVGTQVFSAQKLYEQKEFNETLKSSTTRRGNFVWNEQAEHSVSFYDDPDGFFEVSWMPNPEERCKFEYDGRGLPQPLNTHIGLIAVDPYDHKDTVSSKQSDAAASGFKRFDINDPTNSNCFFLNYVGRRDDPDLFYEDMIMAGVFFGMKIFVENQKPGLINHMNRRMYKHYIHTTKQSDYTKSDSKKRIEGVSMSGKLVRDQAINGLVSYVYKYVGKISKQVQRDEYGWADKDLRDDLYGNCPFDDQIDDWLKFDAEKWTVFDQTVASMIVILGITPVRKNFREENKEDIDLSLGSLVKTYKL
tara:strand:+ start:11778 stop:13850 length:2073 start_codon:yes stop_codon:yes gene_type:complete